MNTLLMDTIMSTFSLDVGIDLGTSNTPLIVKNSGVKLREPSYIAMDLKKKRIIAIGHEARLMFGRNHNTIQIMRPVKDSVISNFEMASAMMEHMLKRIKSYGFFRPRIMIGIPSGVSEVERRALQEAARLAGGRVVYLVDQPIAAAIGAELPIMDSRGSMLLDLGGGTSEISVLTLGGIVVSRSSRTAGEKMDESIKAMVRRNYNLLIGDITSEEIKCQIGSAIPLDEPVEVIVKGRDLASGLPRALKVSSDDVYEALRDNINSIIDLIKNCIEWTPPELIGGMLDAGIIMTGGLSQLRGLDRALTRILRIPFRIAPDPTFCVARGIEKIFNDQYIMNTIFEKRKRRHKNTAVAEGGN